MDNATTRIIASIYIALCSALSSEGVRLANDVLLGFADDQDNPKEDAAIYRLLAESAAPDRAEYEWLDNLINSADMRIAH